MGEEHLHTCTKVVCTECMKMCCLAGENSIVNEVEAFDIGFHRASCRLTLSQIKSLIQYIHHSIVCGLNRALPFRL